MLSQQWVTVAPWLRPGLNMERLRNKVPTLLFWGLTGGVVALSFFEPTTLARRDIFSKLPLVGGFWKRKMEERERVD
jgi:hypothetical protein